MALDLSPDTSVPPTPESHGGGARRTCTLVRPFQGPLQMVTVIFQREVTTGAMTDFLLCFWNSDPLTVKATCLPR